MHSPTVRKLSGIIDALADLVSEQLDYLPNCRWDAESGASLKITNTTLQIRQPLYHTETRS